MNKNLSWRELKALNDLYRNGRTIAKVQNHPYINYLRQEVGVLDHKLGNTKVLLATIKFKELYKKYFESDFLEYSLFFSSHSFLKPQSNFKERDIRVLMLVEKQKEQILLNKYSRKKFSSHFFGDSKYVKPESGLEKAILNILEITAFHGQDPKEQQYRLVLDCKTPSCIVICENIDFLLYPDEVRKNDIWLWYVGGNNIKKLEHLPKIELPIFYSCDWDYDGLRIYQSIKDKIPSIELLYPNAVDQAKPIDSGNHKSDWRYELPLSGLRLDNRYFNERAICLINELMKNEEWIEEETNDLLQMIKISRDHSIISDCP